LPSEPLWITAETVIQINRHTVRLTGEPYVLSRPDLLDSACAKPRNHWAYGERDMSVLATELLFGLAKNHPFTQGNKRTALTAMIGFLIGNGYRLAVQDDVDFANEIIAVIEGRQPQARFAAMLQFLISPPV
jgi:death-on-curing protein